MTKAAQRRTNQSVYEAKRSIQLNANEKKREREKKAEHTQEDSHKKIKNKSHRFTTDPSDKYTLAQKWVQKRLMQIRDKSAKNVKN